jgi:hypothetical protein
MEDVNSGSKIIEVSLSSESSDIGKCNEVKKRGRTKRGRKKKGDNGSLASESMDGAMNGQEDSQKRQEKIDKRKELLKKHLEDVKWQAVDKILNEKSKKEREKEKKLKKDIEDGKAKEAAMEEKLKQALSSIHIKHCKDGQVTLSFPRGVLLPKVLSQEAKNGHVIKKSQIKSYDCLKCGKPSKYCNPSSKKYSCSLECYKALN